MTREALELIFVSSALFGSAVLLLSSVGPGVHVRVHVPHIRLPHVRMHHADDATALPIVVGFLAMFGIGGLFGIALGGDMVVQAALAFAAGAAGASLVMGIFGALRRAQGREPTSLGDLVGRSARVIVSVGHDVRGTVQLRYDGAVQTLPATSDRDISRGQEVVIVAVTGMAVAVRALPPP
jgi:membrane protein implicated in regulation of membrane protease activity